MFAWWQDGKRTLITGGTGAQDGIGGTAGTAADYDRTRSGLGMTFRKSKYRATAEYIKADGMIFDGTDGGAVPGTANAAGTTFATFNIAPVDRADGYYADFGYLVLPNLELDVRYDTLNRRTDVAANERKFTTTTLGAQYFFNKKTRVALNYEFRDAEAPNLPASNAANQILDATDNRVSVQLTMIF
jgi:predicted porin